VNTSGSAKNEGKRPASDPGVGPANPVTPELLSDIQQPLTGIRGFAQILRDKAEPGLRDHALAILAQVERIEQLLAGHRRRLQAGGDGSAAPHAAVAGPAPIPAAARRSILVVDDEEVMRSLLVSLLEPEGYVIHLAESGDQALQMIAKQRFDLIISDKNLPGSATGLEVARAARARHMDIPVILITGYASLETAQEGLEIGLVDYIEKPFDDIAEVRRRVREVLEQERPAPPAVAAAAGEERRLVVVVEDRSEDAAKICEAVLTAGGRPKVATTVVQALGIVSSEHAAGIILSLDLKEGTPTRESLRQLRSCADALVTVSERTSMEQTVVAIRMGASACLPRALASPQALARELVRLFPLGAEKK
jgi:DNA-binding response OmpR family regulator